MRSPMHYAVVHDVVVRQHDALGEARRAARYCMLHTSCGYTAAAEALDLLDGRAAVDAPSFLPSSGSLPASYPTETTFR
jgi:hypothetical protein